LLGGPGRGGAGRNDNVDPEGSQLGREAREPLGLPLGISVFDHEVAALDITEVTQSPEESLSQMGARRRVIRQIADPSDSGRRLGFGGGERHGEDAAGEPP
jgi:hypothetical protein